MENIYMDLNTFKAENDIQNAEGDGVLIQLLERASRLIDNWCGRRFYVEISTKNYRIELADPRLFIDDLVSIESITVDTVDLAADNYELEPLNGLPKTSIRHLTGNFGLRELVAVTGSWGFSNDQVEIAELSAEINDSVTTLAPKKMPNFSIGQTIWIGTEQMFVKNVDGENLTVDRGKNGSTAATHLVDAPIYVQAFAPEVRQATLIQAVRWHRGKDAAWADTVGPIEAETRYQWQVHHSITFVLAQLRRIHNFGF